LLAVPRHHLGLGRDPLRKKLPECVGHARVQLLACSLEQRFVRRFLDQRVLEGVRGRRRFTACEKDVRVDQPREPLAERGIVHARRGRQQRIPELPSQHRRPLRHLLRGGEPIQATHQRVGEAGRDVRHAARASRLHHRLGQLLGVERHTVGPGNECVERGRGQPGARERGDQVARLVVGEAREREGRRRDTRRPRRRELRPRRSEQQDPCRRTPLDQLSQELQSRGVRPVQVFDEQDERLHCARREVPACQQVDRLAAPWLRAELEWGRRLQPEDVRHERHVLRRSECSESNLQLGEPLGRRVIGGERQALGHECDDRMEGCPLGERRRPAFEPRVRHPRQALVQLVDES